MSTLWNKFTAWLSGWPLDKTQEKQVREDDFLLAEAEAEAKSKSTKPKTKKPKGLNPKKKKKSKGKKQGNLS